MEKLEYSIEINASREQVWDTMLHPVTYREWTKESWPDTFYDGKWEAGTIIKFISGDGGGTAAFVEETKQFELIKVRQVAVVKSDGTEDTTSQSAKDWSGTTEQYAFHEKDGKTTVEVTIETSPPWIDMFEEGWPVALESLKKVCERQAREELDHSLYNKADQAGS